jgi:hypothetical protein
MRAILINPETQSLTEIELKTGHYKEINQAIGCKSLTLGAWLSGSIKEGFDAIDVSDDYLEDREDPRFWFQVDSDRNPPTSYPIAGNGLAVGIDQAGETCDVRISLDELRRRITFTQRKFRGFKTYSGEAARARGADFIVEAVAPIIDGAGEGDKAMSVSSTDFVDVYERRRQYGPDFYLPPDARLDQLQPGDCIKVCRNDERFWVLVSDSYGTTITGTVNNQLVCTGNEDLPLGTPIVCERRHVYDVILVHAGEREGETR